ncbi:MAG TPA: hypothetical protein VGW38_18980, partial [Chloroflexota bacterium]|nr:hypothetical protein [Chloroflexota bacterium]
MRRATALVVALALVFAVALRTDSSVPTASAAPQFVDVTFGCGFGSLRLLGFENATAGTTKASWGVADYTGYQGHWFASTWVKVTYLENPAGTIVVDQPALPGEQVVTCYREYSHSTAKIVLLTPLPAPPPAVLYSGVGPAAEPGVYRDWVVRSSPFGRCFVASPLGEYGTILNFCVDQPPQLWDIVDLDYHPGQESRVTVRGTLSQTASPNPPAISDTVAPTTHASVTPHANSQGWHNASVTVSLTAQDNLGGSSVKEITYSASGAQTVPATTTASASASLTLTVEGQTTISFFAKDNAGNVEATKTLTVKLDATPPKLVVTAPTAGPYLLNQVVNAAYTCT